MLSIVHPKSLIDTKVEYGKNVIIEMGTAIHTCSKIGNNVFLGGDALIGHHNKIGNHVLIGGNVSFGGSVITEDYVSNWRRSINKTRCKDWSGFCNRCRRCSNK